MITTERAIAFVRHKVETTALVILPLAAAAVQAHAGSINPGPTFAFTSGDFAGSALRVASRDQNFRGGILFRDRSDGLPRL